MARPYEVGDVVRITRKKSVSHLRAGGLDIVGRIVEVRPKVGMTREETRRERRYGIKFPDRDGVWPYAGWEFTRVPIRGTGAPSRRD